MADADDAVTDADAEVCDTVTDGDGDADTESDWDVRDADADADDAVTDADCDVRVADSVADADAEDLDAENVAVADFDALIDAVVADSVCDADRLSVVAVAVPVRERLAEEADPVWCVRVAVRVPCVRDGDPERDADVTGVPLWVTEGELADTCVSVPVGEAIDSVVGLDGVSETVSERVTVREGDRVWESDSEPLTVCVGVSTRVATDTGPVVCVPPEP